MTEDASTKKAADAPEESDGFFSVRTRWIILAVLLVVTIGGTFGYWEYRSYYPATENAYIGSNIVRVAPEVSGPVARVYVDTDETVKEDDPLFDIDPTLYKVAVRAAQAEFDATVAASGTAADDLKKAAQALSDKQKALEDALQKYKGGQSSGGGSTATDPSQEQAWHDAVKAYREAEDAFVKAQEANLAITTPTVKLRGAAAKLQKTMHDLVKTHVLAPSAGIVSTVDVRPGSTLQQGHPVFAIIEGQQWWVDANFKETEIERIKPGQTAEVKLDMYPGVTFKGTVESISPGSGATFSVLPPENATGNWVKVTQRFPVRIRITDPKTQASHPLRVGASANVVVDTTEDSSDTADSGAGGSASASGE